MLIDTHCHLNFFAFKNDASEVIKRALENNIWMINVGTKYETSEKAVEIAQKYNKGVWAAVGLHPIHLETGLVKIKNDSEEIEVKTKEESFDYEKYRELAKNEKVVAIGEIGLDYYWRPKTKRKKELLKQKQKDLLFQQLQLAEELNLPVIFHCRMAHQDLIQFLKENEKIRPEKAVAHGFVGTVKELKEYLNFGYYIGFNGIIFKNIEGIDFEENIKYTPLNRILLETDCPYLTPPGFEEERNNPLGLKITGKYLAKVKKVSFEEIAEITSENAKRLFKLK